MSSPTVINRATPTFGQRLLRDLRYNKLLWIMTIPLLAYYILFHYLPMYGILMAFKDYNAFKGFAGSKWVGFKHFASFFNSIYAWRVIRNTLVINSGQLILGFPAPIILALLMNEVRSSTFKRFVQTVTYMPHFISLVVFCGMIVTFFAKDGLINDFLAVFGAARHSYLLDNKYYRSIYVLTGIWKNIGWGSIVYMAAISRVSQELYEACTIDGGNRFTRLWHVTLPEITPTIVTLFILNMGRLMSEGPQKTILLYSPGTYETADIISSYSYRRGLVSSEYSFGTAVGLFNNVINCLLVLLSNTISRKLTQVSLW